MRRSTCNTKITPIMDMNTLKICKACPVYAIFSIIPKIYIGSSGMSTTSIAFAIMSRNSPAKERMVGALKKAIPSPTVNAKTSEDITSNIAGIFTVKYGAMLSASEMPSIVSLPVISPGKTFTDVKYDRKPANIVSK